MPYNRLKRAKTYKKRVKIEFLDLKNLHFSGTPFLRLISSLFGAYLMPRYALFRAYWVFLGLSRPIGPL